MCEGSTGLFGMRLKPGDRAPNLLQSRWQTVKVWKAHLKGIRCCSFSLSAIHLKILFLKRLTFGKVTVTNPVHPIGHLRVYI